MEVLADFGRIDADLEATTCRYADVALLYNCTAGIWESHDKAENSWEADVQFIYWALRHAGYNVDVIPKEDIENGVLKNYKVLYINGEYIRQATAIAIAAWLQKGSGRVLVGTAGVGARTEKNVPTSILNDLFGIYSSNLTRLQKAGRPLYEIKGLTTLTQATINLPTPTSLDVLAWREELIPSTATVFGTDAEGRVVATKRTIGNHASHRCNTAIRYGFLPGLTYIHEAWDEVTSFNEHVAVGFDIELRDLISYGASLGATKLAETNTHLMEISRFDKTGCSVIFLINHDYEAGSQNVTVDIPDCSRTTSVTTARQGSVSFQNLHSGKIRLNLLMDRSSDVLVINRSGHGKMNLSPGWSMISLPVIPDNATLSELFPEALVMYMYKMKSGYMRVKGNDDLEAGRGYWILLNDAQSYSING